MNWVDGCGSCECVCGVEGVGFVVGVCVGV